MAGHDGILEDMSSRLISPAFIGRHAELASLRAAFETARQGEPVTVLLGGEAGAGKSRLATEFAGHVRSAGGRVLTGSCLELGSDGLPFAPFTALLRDLVREDGVAVVIGLAGGRAGELARLLPDLGPAEPEPGEPAGDAFPGEGRGRLFEQMLTVLEQISERAPVVLIVEDLHWADRSTRDLLAFLVANQRALPGVLIVGTFRSDDLHRTHPLRPLLAELSRLGWVRRAELPRLDRGETGDLMTAILGGEADPARLDSVFARSEGNPLFTEELLCCDDVLPETLRDLVLIRVQRLPAETQEVLRVASAAGDPTGHVLLGRVTRLSDSELERALRPAVAQNVLIAGADGYAFRHALIREAMYEDLLPGERVRVHTVFAEAIAADPALAGARPAIQLAHHWYAAHDLGQALASAWQAAAEANRVFAYAEQLAMLAKVSELWGKVPDAAERIGTSHDRVLEKAARVAHLTGDDERGRAFASAALSEIATSDPGRTAVLLELRARFQRDNEEAIADLRRALSLAGGPGYQRERAVVLARLALRLGKAGQPGECRTAAEEALALAERTGDLAAQAEALDVLAMLGPGSRPFCQGADLGMLARARSVAARAGDYHVMLRTTINESHVLEGAGEHERAAQVARDGIAEAGRYGMARTQGTFLAVNLAEPLYALGRWDEATEVIERALELSAPAATRASLLLLSGLIAVGRGDLKPARHAAETAAQLRAGSRYQDQFHLPLALLKIELATAEHRYREALDAAGDPVRRYDLQPSPRYAWPVLVAGVRTAAEAVAAPAAVAGEDCVTAAAGLLDALSAEAEKLEADGPVQDAHRLTFGAELQRARNAPTADQAQAFQRAAAAWDAAREPYPMAVALLRAAEAVLASGPDRDGVADQLRRAAAAARELGARPLREAIAQLARRARIPLGGSERPATGEAGLTARELDVLRLVAAGMSNARIAAELFISPKTASVHVSNIMSKLGAANRGEAAAAAHERSLLG
jgi:DNA-binding NarL/FixJ family response regulator